MRPRVGHIQFLNCFPLYYGLVKNMDILDMELIPGAPTELNRLMLEERLDISPMSSIEYYRNKEKVLLLPNLSVSSDGQVKSILLVSKVPMHELDGEEIALTNTSATSQILLKIILEKYGVNARYFECIPDIEAMLTKSKACLLIGDDALFESVNDNGLYHYDLGDEWKKLTGKKMVYAVWCVRKNFADENKNIVRETLGAFNASYNYSKQNIDKILARVLRWGKFNLEFLKEYFSNLDFCFDKNAQEGLMRFLSMARESGYLTQNGSLEFFDKYGR